MKMKDVLNRLFDVQQKCKERIVTEEDIINAVKSAENRLLDLRIPKKSWVNCKIRIGWDFMPNSYKYAAHGTFVLIERKKTTWEVISISRDRIYSKSNSRGWKETTLTLSKTAIDSMSFVYHI